MANQEITAENGEESTNTSRRASNHSHISCGTFIPFFTLDSEYLKSLLIGKGYICELEEPASAKSFHGFFPREITRQDSGEDTLSSSESALNSPIADSQKADFLIECEFQLRKLFAFMDLHLSKVESNLTVVQNVKSASAKEEEEVAEKDIELSTNTYFSDSLSESEKAAFLDSGVEDNQLNSPKGIVNHLKEVLLSLQESLNSSFASLDELTALHDDTTCSHDGQSYLQTKESKKREFERRISACLEKIESELQVLDLKDEVHPDSLEAFRMGGKQFTEQVKKTPISRFTYLSFFLFLVIWGVMCYMYFSYQNPWVVYLRVLRSPLLIVFYLYLYGINMKVWANVGINYVSIFNYFLKGIPTPKFVNKVAAIFTAYFALSVIILLFVSPFSSDIPGKVIPLIMWLSLLAFLINPANVYLRRGRLSFLTVVVRILLAPFIFVYFGDFWFADQLNSTVAFLLDIQYLSCYLISDPWIPGTEMQDADDNVCTQSSNGIRPIISCLPALWRLFQCLRCLYDTREVRHLMNAVKYATTFPVIVFATLFAVKVERGFSLAHLDFTDVGWIIICWLLSSFVHALYTFIWDIYCDWGLLQLRKGTLLRPKILYRSKCFYFIAIVLDMILRFAWTLKLTLAIVWRVDSDLIYTGLVIAEILRRFVWNFFRVEYEQIVRSEKE